MFHYISQEISALGWSCRYVGRLEVSLYQERFIIYLEELISPRTYLGCRVPRYITFPHMHKTMVELLCLLEQGLMIRVQRIYFQKNEFVVDRVLTQLHPFLRLETA